MSTPRPDPPLSFEIELLPVTAASDGELVATLTDLVNRVYERAEEGLWIDGVTRTTAPEVAEMIAAGQIAVARTAGGIVGAIRVQQLAGGEGELGMLVADFAHRGEGIGDELIRFGEELCRQRGRTVMQLELLVPREWSHPIKEFLYAWYVRLGYRRVRAGSLVESYPALAPLLATPCEFFIYHKRLDP